MWFNMYGATPGSVEGHQTREDGLAKNPRSPYQAMFRSGSHQSATRGWLKPTWMTDSLVRKDLYGHSVNKGFLPDVHCPTGAPREAIVKITKAEPDFERNMTTMDEKLGAGFVQNLAGALGTEAALALTGLSTSGPTGGMVSLSNNPAGIAE